MLDLPLIQLFPSLYCNLKCPYCSQVDVRQSRPSRDCLYTDHGFLNTVESLPRTHFYVSGGEPLIQAGLQDFLTVAARNGHIVSFDTNGVVPLRTLETILDRFSPELWGFFNISHHILAGVALQTISRRLALLRLHRIPHFVKYIGTPGEIDTISNHMDTLRDEGTGVMVTILETYSVPWQGRSFPREYTDEELARLLSMVTLNTHALQFFGGIRSQGLFCAGGCSYITYNMKGRRETTSCCHNNKEIATDSTLFKGCNRRRIRCTIDLCLGDLMFILGIQGLFDEKERFTRICNGHAPSIGLQNALTFIGNVEQSAQLAFPERFHDFEAKFEYRVSALRP